MTLKRTTGLKPGKPLAPISAGRLKEFGGRMPFNSLEKPGDAKPTWKPKQWTDTGPDQATVELVLRRDSDASGKVRCACCGDPLYGWRGFEWCIAHRKLRAHGVDNRTSNLYASCMDCERQTHAHPERSYDAGWMVLSTDNPEEIAFEHHGGTCLLDDEGGRTVIEALREEADAEPF